MKPYQTKLKPEEMHDFYREINLVAEDYDYTTAKDSAFVRSAIGYGLNITNPYDKKELAKTGIYAIPSILKDKKDAHSKILSDLFEVFGPSGIDQIFVNTIKKENKYAELLPGVSDLHKALEGSEFYVNSRNDERVIGFTTDILNVGKTIIPFENIYGRNKKDNNKKDKGESLYNIIQNFKEKRPEEPINILIRDDTMSGDPAVQIAKELYHRGQIDNFLVQAVGNGKFSRQPYVDIITTPDQTVFAQEVAKARNVDLR